jgi:hypothetical protein
MGAPLRVLMGLTGQMVDDKRSACKHLHFFPRLVPGTPSIVASHFISYTRVFNCCIFTFIKRSLSYKVHLVVFGLW